MLKNYLTTALRQFRKYRSYTIINIVGLSLGITGSLVLFLIVRFWLSFDTYHEKAERIYRVTSTEGYQGILDKTGAVPQPFALVFADEFPEAVAHTPIFHYENFRFDGLITVQEDSLSPRKFQKQEGLGFSTSAFFKIFDRPLLLGDAATVLDAPSSVVISERWADAFYGTGWRQGQPDILNQTLSLDTLINLRITGVMADYPDNTDLPFDLFISHSTMADQSNGWGSLSSYDQFFVLLDEATPPEGLVARFPALVDKYHENAEGETMKYDLQPLLSMHYDMEAGTFGEQEVSRATIGTLMVVAVFLVLIACINFINLTTAVASKRAKEVGVRKVLGGTQRQLVRQFLSETTLITALAMLVVLGLTELVLLSVNDLLELSLSFDMLTDPTLILLLLVVVVVVSTLSGAYPAWVLARFRPAEAFQSSLVRHSGSFSLRRGLIVFQFVIAQALIIATLVLVRQMQYIRQADLGYDRATIVTIPAPGDALDRKKTLRDRLQRLSAVEEVSLTFSDPTSSFINVSNFTLAGQDKDYYAELKFADQYYREAYGLRLLAGRGLDAHDTITSAMVNEALLREVGLANPAEALGQVIRFQGKEVPIRGVVQDFHTQSMRDKITPVMVLNYARPFNQAALRLQTDDLKSTLAAIEAQWQQVYEGYDYEYEFLDDKLADLYQREERLSLVLAVAAGVIILISCLGLYGLVTFMAEQKTKEIGVRKVLGASVFNIVGLFSREFVKLVVIAFGLAAPLAYYATDTWLQSFAYKISLDWKVFAAGILATLAIALLTVGYRSLRAARANPVDSLRNE